MEGTIGQNQNKHTTHTNLDQQSTQRTMVIYSKHHRMATHHWVIICGIKHHVQVGDYSELWENGPLKQDDDGDEDGDVDEDDHRGDGSPDGTPAPPRERGSGSPPCASSSMAAHLSGERFSLWSLASMAIMETTGMMKMAFDEDDPLRQGAGEGQDWFFVALEACGGGTPNLGFCLGVLEFIGIFDVSLTLERSRRKSQARGARPREVGRQVGLWLPRPLRGLALVLRGSLLIHKNHHKFSAHSENFYFCIKSDTMKVMLKTTSVRVNFNKIIPKLYKIIVNMT